MQVKVAGRSGLIEFRPRARLLKLIGAELISDDVLAITELVKNAHDADASMVVVEFRGVTGGSGEIVVRDDGHGMDLDVLLGQWMQPAASSKSGAAARITAKRRRVLGEKGVGRFAADKLGRQLELVSRRKGEASEIRALFDWDEFDTDDRLLSEIKSRWEVRAARALPGHGTILRISGLRATWNERMFRRIATRLSRLRSPFREVDTFTIRMESDEFPQYSGELRSELLERAPYRIEAQFDGQQTIEVCMDGSTRMRHPWNGNGALTCGPVKVRIFAFDLETEAVARIGPRTEVRGWLREWSGISVYRDGFRVWPYGEPHDDWLRLDQRRVNNPVVRLSNNQVVGFVEISRDRNPDLVDQTNREGLIHGHASDDLQRLIHFVLQLLEAERQAVRHPPVRNTAGSRQAGLEQDPIAHDIERLVGKVDETVGGELRRIASRAREHSMRQEAMHRRYLEGYSELAALGQAAIGISKSMGPQLELIRTSCARVRQDVRGRGSRNVLAELKAIEESLEVVMDRVAMIRPIEAGRNQRRRALDVPSELAAFRELLAPLLRSAGVEMEIERAAGGVLRIEMRPETFHRLLHILATNSMEWMEGVSKPCIRITCRIAGEHCEIVFSDNGPGIPASIAARAFEPLFSSKEGGRGMGLTIARSIAELHGGEICALVDGRRRGASIRVLLPRKRSRATIHE